MAPQGLLAQKQRNQRVGISLERRADQHEGNLLWYVYVRGSVPSSSMLQRNEPLNSPRILAFSLSSPEKHPQVAWSTPHIIIPGGDAQDGDSLASLSDSGFRVGASMCPAYFQGQGR